MRPEQSKPESPLVGPLPPHTYGSPIWAIAVWIATWARWSGSPVVERRGAFLDGALHGDGRERERGNHGHRRGRDYGQQDRRNRDVGDVADRGSKQPRGFHHVGHQTRRRRRERAERARGEREGEHESSGAGRTSAGPRSWAGMDPTKHGRRVLRGGPRKIRQCRHAHPSWHRASTLRRRSRSTLDVLHVTGSLLTP